MHSKWNNKINQGTENTLVVGMDIAKRIHYACFVDERGRVIEKAFAVHQSKEGFENLYEKIRQMMKEAKKTEVIIGIEPTGHYWMNLAYFLDQYGIPLVMVNPMHVKRSKELDDNLPTKNDKKDALVIARLLKDGRFSYPRILKEVEAELRIGSTLRLKLKERQEKYTITEFDFLGYTFRKTFIKDRTGRLQLNFLPSVSKKSAKSFRDKSKAMRIHRFNGSKKSLIFYCSQIFFPLLAIRQVYLPKLAY